MACGGNDVSRDALASQPSPVEKTTPAVRQAKAPQRQAKERSTLPKGHKGPWVSKYEYGVTHVLLDKQGNKTTRDPHVHVIHDDPKGFVQLHISDKGSPRHSHYTFLYDNPSGNRVNAAISNLCAILEDRSS